MRGRTPRLIPLDHGKTTLPSVISLSPQGKWLLGATARDQIVLNPRNTIYGAKRLIGRQSNSLAVEELRRYYPYEIVEGERGEAAVLLEGEVHSLTDLSARILAHVKSLAEASLNASVTDAIISVPAYYNDNQRHAVKEAGRRAGFNVRRIVNEPTAAALAFGFNRDFDKKILVYDLGGGTFDVSVMQLSNNVFEVIATGGDSFLGGVDLDNRIIDFILEELRRLHQLDLSDDPAIMQRVKAAAETAKCDLSFIPTVVIDLPYLTTQGGRQLDVRLQLSREELNARTGDLIERTFDICRRVLEEKNLTVEDIDDVLLVGGQSRMPLIHQKIEAIFGKPPRKGVHPDECVSVGATLLGEALGSNGAVTLIDVLSMPIGIALSNGSFRKILDRNSTVPTSMSFRLPAPKSADTRFLSLDIFQGDQPMVVNNEYLGTLRVPAVHAGRKIEFRLDTEALLRVVLDLPEGPMQIELTTCDTPLILRQALVAEKERRHAEEVFASARARKTYERPTFLDSLKRILGGGVTSDRSS